MMAWGRFGLGCWCGRDQHDPDIGHLLDLFQAWTPDEATRTRILVTNPARLYGFPP
jgi:predicted TIM-barrel fold metal-dependent hydrolase